MEFIDIFNNKSDQSINSNCSIELLPLTSILFMSTQPFVELFWNFILSVLM